MRKVLLLLIGFTIAGMLNAQKPITFTDDEQTFGNVDFPGVWVTIPETSLETVQKNWVKTIQKGTKSKPVIKGHVISLFGAMIPEIYSGPINIESVLTARDSAVMLFTGVELKRGELASQGSVEYDKLKSYLKSFAKSQYIDVVKNQISDEEKALKNVEKELAKSRKSSQKLVKKVKSTQSSVARLEDNILSLRKQLDVANLEIDKVSTRLSLSVDPQAQKAAKSDLKKAQKSKKSLLKKVSSAESKISKSSTSISDANMNMNANKKIQEDIGVRVNAQKMKLNGFKQKLKVIESY